MSAIGITTKYIGPTNYRPGRIKAWMPDMKDRRAVTIEYNHELDQFGAHKEAAVLCAHKHGLSGTLIACSLDRGYCFTFLGNGLGTHVVTANQNGAGV